ncbi:acyl--CoA ligase [Candidatus Micrarchaeota archaeon]|nr:acyl--CoA ligase [Candidatus Micrarchaeota archaeon]
MTSDRTARHIVEIFNKNWNLPFIVDVASGTTLSYANFFGNVLEVKKKIETAGIKKHETVCLIMHNSLELLILYFSLLIMDVTVVPIDPNKGMNQINEILSYVKNARIMSNVDGIEIPDTIEASKLFDMNAKYSADKKELDIFEKADYSRNYLTAFTSGSTGEPKGVKHSFNNLFMTAIAFGTRFEFGKDNTFYHALPMTYMAGILNSIFLPFLFESRIVIGERFAINNVTRFWKMPAKYDVNVFWFTPTMLSLLLKLDRGTEGINYASGKKIIGCVGTAPLNAKIGKEFTERYGIPVYESYGLSETLFTTTNFPEDDHDGPGVGKGLNGVELEIANDGEVLIGAPWMFMGYLNVETATYFMGDKYCSGDLGKFDKDGRLVITGRKKDLIIKGGMNISPKKVEDYLSEQAFFDDAVVIGIEDIYMGEKTVCFFVTGKKGNSQEHLKQVNADIIELLGRDYRVDEFFELTEIPKNINGKTDKIRIREMYNANRGKK